MEIKIAVLFDNGVQKDFVMPNVKEENSVNMRKEILELANAVFSTPNSCGSIFIEGVGVINLTKTCSIEVSFL